MHLLMTADTIGGVWTYALDLIRALAARDVTVTLATMGAPLSAEQRAEARRLPSLEVRESRYKLEWMPDPWTDVARAGDWLRELERETCPDLVHLNGYVHGAVSFNAPVLIVAHSCVLSWWRAVKGEEAPPEWNRYAHAVCCGLHHAQAIIAPTRAMLSALEQGYGPFDRIPTMVIPNGRDDRLYRVGPLSEKEPWILTAGRLWDEAKNIALLERAAPKLDWPVHAAGEGCPQAGKTAVRFLGRLRPEELACHLRRAAIYALPARYEPFGLSVLEAALSGCALVLGDIESLRENWDGAARFVPPDDADALRDALNGLAHDPAWRARLAARARERAQGFTPCRMAVAYLNLYRRLVPPPTPPSYQPEKTLLCVS
jgi:glycogen synthase